MSETGPTPEELDEAYKINDQIDRGEIKSADVDGAEKVDGDTETAENIQEDIDPEKIINDILSDETKAEQVGSYLQDYWGNFDSLLPGGGKRKYDKNWKLDYGKTYEEAFSDLDNIIKELGLDVDKIEQIQREIRASIASSSKNAEEARMKSKERVMKNNELCRYIAPAYLAMLKKGYKHGELYR